MPLISMPPRNGRSSVRVKRPGEKRSVSRSAARALDVLELFGVERRQLRAVEIAERLDLPPSTANQLLKTMVDSGHLVFEVKSKGYLPSPRLLGFGRWLTDSYGDDEGLRELVVGLQARINVSVTLTTPNDLFMQIVDLAAAPGDTPERGLQISVFGSVIGSAYLATLPDDEIVRLCHRARISSDQSATIASVAEQIRIDGFADGPSPDSAVWSIAMPLPREGLDYCLILAVAGPIDDVRPRREALITEMRDAITSWRTNRPDRR